MAKLPAGFKAQGFTLVELMIVVAIAAILMALAAPSFNRIIQENSTRTQASRVVTSINAARSAASVVTWVTDRAGTVSGFLSMSELPTISAVSFRNRAGSKQVWYFAGRMLPGIETPTR